MLKSFVSNDDHKYRAIGPIKRLNGATIAFLTVVSPTSPIREAIYGNIVERRTDNG